MQTDTPGGCSLLQSDITCFTSRSPADGMQNQPGFSVGHRAFLQLSTHFPLRVCVLHHSDVMMNVRAAKQGRRREGVKSRGKVSSPLTFYRSISSWKSPHLLRAVLHSSPIVAGKTHFLSASAVNAIVEHPRDSEEPGTPLKTRHLLDAAVCGRHAEPTSGNNATASLCVCFHS